MSIGLNEFGKINGSIQAKSAPTDLFFSDTGSYEEVAFQEHFGKMWKVVTVYDYDIVKNAGVKLGRSHYSGAKSGSSFKELGNDWYMYIKVTGITVTPTDVTSAWTAGQAITV